MLMGVDKQEAILQNEIRRDRISSDSAGRLNEMSVLEQFHPAVRAWFERRFAAPTEAQARGWPEILAGRDTLISAPTGSGKTLAAFLVAIDRLFRRAAESGPLPGAIAGV